jgi:octaprenyl-diphosphate synthase
MVIGVHHQAARENPDAAFEHAHVYVHFKAVYILPPEKGGGKGDDGHIGAAQKFLHIKDVEPDHRHVERDAGNDDEK